jgi:hypothetical protein
VRLPEAEGANQLTVAPVLKRGKDVQIFGCQNGASALNIVRVAFREAVGVMAVRCDDVDASRRLTKHLLRHQIQFQRVAIRTVMSVSF